MVCSFDRDSIMYHLSTSRQDMISIITLISNLIIKKLSDQRKDRHTLHSHLSLFTRAFLPSTAGVHCTLLYHYTQYNTKVKPRVDSERELVGDWIRRIVETGSEERAELVEPGSAIIICVPCWRRLLHIMVQW